MTALVDILAFFVEQQSAGVRKWISDSSISVSQSVSQYWYLRHWHFRLLHTASALQNEYKCAQLYMNWTCSHHNNGAYKTVHQHMKAMQLYIIWKKNQTCNQFEMWTGFSSPFISKEILYRSDLHKQTYFISWLKKPHLLFSGCKYPLMTP